DGFQGNEHITPADGDSYEINKLNHSLDQPNRHGGDLVSTSGAYCNSAVASGTPTVTGTCPSGHGLTTANVCKWYGFSANSVYAFTGAYQLASVPDSTHFTFNLLSSYTGTDNYIEFTPVPVAPYNQTDLPSHQWLNSDANVGNLHFAGNISTFPVS